MRASVAILEESREIGDESLFEKIKAKKQQQLEGGVIFGLSGALHGDITVEKGQVVQSNFNNFRIIRQNEAPVIDVVLVKSNEKPGGTGEPSVSLIGAAVGNAIFAATGKRIRTLPLAKGLKSA
jgi:isoquinoline 1-oxidoreductase beta subunit